MTKLGSQKLQIGPKVTKLGSIIGHRIDYNGVATLRGRPSPPGKEPDEMHYFICDPLVLMGNLCYRLTEFKVLLKEHKV